MKTIVEGNPSVTKIWGQQKVKDTSYRLMRYLLRTECDDGLLVYNVVTGELVLLNQEEANSLDSLHSADINVLAPMINHHFLVPISFNEKRSVDRIRQILRKITGVQNITNYTILPTTDCNANCFYCYESNFPHITMTEDTAHKLVAYIIDHCGDNKKVNIHWFGGEPLIGHKCIDQICKELTDNGIQINSRMTSNAYLFTKDMITRAKENWFLNKIQVTLDGTEDIYNSIKAFNSSSSSPYYRVLDNIGHLAENEVQVTIRLNLGIHNISNLKVLVDEISERFPSKKYISIYTDILFENEGFQPIQYSNEDSALLEAAKVQLNHYINKKGFGSSVLSSLPRLTLSHCMADSGSCLLVSPLGEFSLCEHAVYDNIIGHIGSKSLDYEAIAEWSVTNDWKTCNECPLYPKCVLLKKCVDLTPCHEIELNNELIQYTNMLKLQYNKVVNN